MANKTLARSRKPPIKIIFGQDYFRAEVFLKPIYDMTSPNHACNGKARWRLGDYVLLVALCAAFLAAGFLVAVFFATVFFVTGFFGAAFRFAGLASMAWFLGESALAAPFGGVVVSNS